MSDGFANNIFVTAKDPDFDPATYVALSCNHLSISACDCPKGPVYAFRDGKPVVEDSRFQHIFMNTRSIKGFDMKSSQWRGLSIWDLQTSIFNTASTLCHEFAHAFMIYHVGRDAYMNDESISETGFSWENFTFGGVVQSCPGSPSTFLMPWPNLDLFEDYTAASARMGIRYFGKL